VVLYIAAIFILAWFIDGGLRYSVSMAIPVWQWDFVVRFEKITFVSVSTPEYNISNMFCLFPALPGFLLELPIAQAPVCS